jgi:hypothetical protein
VGNRDRIRMQKGKIEFVAGNNAKERTLIIRR